MEEGRGGEAEEEGAGASVEELGEMLLELARKGAHGGVARVLRMGARADHRGMDGRQALHVACARGEREAARALLEGGADPSAVTLGGASALGLALKMGDDAIGMDLIAAGADPNGRDQWGAKALRLACERGCPGSIKALLLAGADPNDLGEGVGYGALGALTRERWFWEQNLGREAEGAARESARLLLSAGADPGRRGEDGKLPFESARAQPWAQALADDLERAWAAQEAGLIEASALSAPAGRSKRSGL